MMEVAVAQRTKAHDHMWVHVDSGSSPIWVISQTYPSPFPSFPVHLFNGPLIINAKKTLLYLYSISESFFVVLSLTAFSSAPYSSVLPPVDNP